MQLLQHLNCFLAHFTAAVLQQYLLVRVVDVYALSAAEHRLGPPHLVHMPSRAASMMPCKAPSRASRTPPPVKYPEGAPRPPRPPQYRYTLIFASAFWRYTRHQPIKHLKKKKLHCVPLFPSASPPLTAPTTDAAAAEFLLAPYRKLADAGACSERVVGS